MMNKRMELCLLVASLNILFQAVENAEGEMLESLDGAWQIVFDRNHEGGVNQSTQSALEMRTT